MPTINRTLIICLSLSLLSCIAYAQRGAIELAAGGGVSINSAPTTNMPYTGTGSPVNYTAQFNALYNIHRNIAIGLDVKMTELSRTADTAYNIVVTGGGKRLMYSKNMMTMCAVANGKVNVMRGYFYGGLAAGYGFNLHSASSLKPAKETYRAPNDGSGFVWGAQVGFTYGVNRFMGIYVEGALRKYNISHDNSLGAGLPVAALNYNITAYNATVGAKFRIMPPRKVQNNIPGMRGEGRSL